MTRSTSGNPHGIARTRNILAGSGCQPTIGDCHSGRSDSLARVAPRRRCALASERFAHRPWHRIRVDAADRLNESTSVRASLRGHVRHAPVGPRGWTGNTATWGCVDGQSPYRGTSRVGRARRMESCTAFSPDGNGRGLWGRRRRRVADRDLSAAQAGDIFIHRSSNGRRIHHSNDRTSVVVATGGLGIRSVILTECRIRHPRRDYPLFTMLPSPHRRIV